MRRLIHCTLPPELVHRPILHDLVRATSAVVNVRRANVDVESGVAWFLLELSGPPGQLDQAGDWLRQQGVTVEPIDA
jgi:NIL domain